MQLEHYDWVPSKFVFLLYNTIIVNINLTVVYKTLCTHDKCIYKLFLTQNTMLNAVNACYIVIFKLLLVLLIQFFFKKTQVF